MVGVMASMSVTGCCGARKIADPQLGTLGIPGRRSAPSGGGFPLDVYVSANPYAPGLVF